MVGGSRVLEETTSYGTRRQENKQNLFLFRLEGILETSVM
jgi:hypothetical protein